MEPEDHDDGTAGRELAVVPNAGKHPVNPQPGKRQSSPWGRFFRRVVRLLARPKAFWNTLAEDEGPSLRELLWPHLVVLALFRGGAGLVGAIAGGAELGASIAYGALTVVRLMVLVAIMSFLAGMIASLRGAKPSLEGTFGWAAFGLTPLFVVGALGAVPVSFIGTAAELITLPLAFYVMSTGIGPALGVKADEQASAAGLLNGALLLLWSLMASLTFLRLPG